jgi:orotidine-5'-phosphate decarboxylase
MTRSFPESLAAAVAAKACPVVVGFDPRPERLPEALSRGASLPAAVTQFCERVIDRVHHLVPCVKPQIAFFEAMGHEGFRASAGVGAPARPRGLLVIGDVKRGDIGSTAEAYARAHFAHADALTVHPLLGTDSVEPFLRYCRNAGKGLFVLVRTSNPSAVEFQDLRCGDRTLSEHIADAVERWGSSASPAGTYSAVGAVVGATWPQELARLRARMPRAWLLLPGVGAQGARVEDLADAFDSQGMGGLVAVSRAATECFEPADPDWEGRILAAVESLRASTGRLRAGETRR